MQIPDLSHTAEREFSIDNLLVRIHFIIVMIRWTGLAPWEFEFLFPGSLTTTLLGMHSGLQRYPLNNPEVDNAWTLR